MEPVVEELIERFRKAPSPAAARTAITARADQAALKSALKDDRFRSKLKAMAELALAGAGEDSLLAAALITRVVASAKLKAEEQETIRGWLRRPSRPPGAPLAAVADNVDRQYAAEALDLVEGDWKPAYLAAALVEAPPNADLSRRPLATALIRSAGNSAAALAALSPAMKGLDISVKDQSTARARRLARVGRSMELAVREEWPPAGPDAGAALASLASGFTDDRARAEPAAEIECAGSIVQLLLMLLRSDIPTAMDPASYAVISRLRRRFSPASWPRELHRPLRAVAEVATQAILTAAQRGVADGGLRRTLGELVGEAQAGEMLARRYGAVSGISSDLAFWLRTGRSPAATPEVDGKTGVLATERELAKLLVEATDTESSLNRTQDSLDLAASLAGDAAKADLTRLSGRIRALTRAVRDAASRRALRLRGRAGQTVEFTPLDHVFAPEAHPTRMVRLVTPIVERALEGREPETVLRANVDPL